MRDKVCVALAACCVVVAAEARAQGSPPLIERLEQSPASAVPQGSPLPAIQPPLSVPVSPSLAAPPVAAAEGPAAGPRAKITDATVTGVTVYAPGTFAPQTARLTGDAVPRGAIEAARAAIVNRYRADGYVFTAADAIVSGGHLRLVVTEGRVASVKLDGDIGPAGTQVLRFLDRLTLAGPLNVRDLERALLLASDIPGVTVRSVLNPSETEPGALTLVAQVARRKFSALLTSDNRAFRQIGPEELLGVFDANSFSALGERTEVSLYHTYNNTNTFGQALTEAFLGGSGLKLRVYGGAGEQIPSDNLRAIGYDGVTRVFGAELTYPVIRSRARTLSVSANIDAVEDDVSVGFGAQARRASFDSLRVLRGGGEYAALDDLAGASRPGTTTVSLRLSQGLPSLGATRNGDPQAPRQNERVDFFKAAGQVARTQTLFAPYAQASVALYGALAGQVSGNILPLIEKFYLGGQSFDRGFYSGEVTGDNALTGTLELRFNTPVPLPTLVTNRVPLTLDTTLYAFADWGETWENRKLDRNRRLQSFGGGARLYLTQHAELDLEGVERQTRFPSGQGPGVSALKATAFYWQVLVRY